LLLTERDQARQALRRVRGLLRPRHERLAHRTARGRRQCGGGGAGRGSGGGGRLQPCDLSPQLRAAPRLLPQQLLGLTTSLDFCRHHGGRKLGRRHRQRLWHLQAARRARWRATAGLHTQLVALLTARQGANSELRLRKSGSSPAMKSPEISECESARPTIMQPGRLWTGRTSVLEESDVLRVKDESAHLLSLLLLASDRKSELLRILR
jgi:hypothetical protein